MDAPPPTAPLPGPGSRCWKLTLSYDGTDFHGWQVQPGRPTIQGELQDALGRITGERPLPQGSGRTDAGVHALAQVASFPLGAPIPPANLRRALNRTLPASIRILDARTMPDAFHARHSALRKTYEYRLLAGDGQLCPPFAARYVYACPWRLDRSALDRSALCLLGEHDFASFEATDPDRGDPDRGARRAGEGAAEERSTVRTIFLSAWEERPSEGGDLLVYRVAGNGFLHHMVRNLVGTMIDAGRGLLGPEDLPAILAARSRAAAGPTAPARGLFLVSVEYGEPAPDSLPPACYP